MDDNAFLEELITYFVSCYTLVFTYHACRPIDPTSYLKEGIKISNSSDLIALLRVNLKKYVNIELTDKDIGSVGMRLDKSYNGRIFVALDDDHLLEFVNILNASSGKVCKNHLKSIGTPTVYKILLPISDIEKIDLSALVRDINNAIYECEIGYKINFTFELTSPVQAASMVGCYHPDRIIDPLEARTAYEA